METHSDTMSSHSYIDDLLNMDDDLKDFKTEPSEISESFKGLNIFITGGSGFIGKLIIEKFLRTCPKIGKIYMLMRAKKGKIPKQRFLEHFDDAIYERLKKEQPDFLKHIILVEGDTALNGLGLSTKSRDMIIENTDIIFHCAATVRFDDTLRQAVTINVKGTKSILLLAKEIQNLKGFIHVSTAFSNCIYDHIEEKFYKPSIDPDNILSLMDLLDDDAFENLTKKFLGKYPNTYVFSKALGEELVRKYNTHIPTYVLRPSITVSTDREPIRGWINNYYGPVGAPVGTKVGVLRTLHCDRSCVAEMIPADYVVNAIIVAGWDLMKKWKEGQVTKPTDPAVFNIVSSVQNPITWNKYMYFNKYYSREVPSIREAVYLIIILIKQRWLYNIAAFLLETIPAIIFDGLILLTGRKPMLMKADKKVKKFSSAISYFSSKEWTFDNNNLVNLWNKVNSSDKETFYFNAENLDWDDYFRYSIRGLRLYIMKEPFSTVPAARIRVRRLWHIHCAFYSVLLFLLGWAIFLRLLPW